MASIFVTSSLPSTIGARFAIFMVYFNRAAFWHRTGAGADRAVRRREERPPREVQNRGQSYRRKLFPRDLLYGLLSCLAARICYPSITR